MATTLETVLPVFALILLGYGAGRFGWIPEAGLKALSTFVFYFSIPALLFRTLAQGIAWDTSDIGLLFAYYGGIAAVGVLAGLLGIFVFRTSWPERIVMALSATYSNTLLMGVPLVVTAFGEAGAVPLFLIISFHATLLIPAYTVLLETSRKGGGPWWRTGANALGAVARNPVVLAVVVGLLYGASGLALPSSLDRLTRLLADAAPATALFALGGSLVRFSLGGDLKEVSVVVALKLLAHPALVALLAYGVFEVKPLWAAIAVVTASLPAGANVFIFAQHYNIYFARAGSAVLISTAVSILTLSILLAALAPAGP